MGGKLMANLERDRTKDGGFFMLPFIKRTNNTNHHNGYMKTTYGLTNSTITGQRRKFPIGLITDMVGLLDQMRAIGQLGASGAENHRGSDQEKIGV
ncbi:hypothetical protein SUGI_0911780 [Cryptomeria japonica]|nr:hypothetical protein SUGI_0911780 [Cryptomeria japonica]